MTNENKIQIYNFETTLTKEFLTSENEVENFLEKIRSLKDIAFDLTDENVVKEVKDLKKQANKSIKVLKEVCAPYEAEGKKIADVRSSISTTLVSGKNNIIDQILQPILEAEAELKRLEETHISSLDLSCVEVKLKYLENLKQFNWLIYKDEALKLIKSLSDMALLRKEALEKEAIAFKEMAEKARIAREEEIARNAAANERLRIERDLQNKEEQDQLESKRYFDEQARKANDIEHKRSIHNEILEALISLPCQSDGDFEVDMKYIIKAIARGEIPNLFIKY